MGAVDEVSMEGMDKPTLRTGNGVDGGGPTSGDGVSESIDLCFGHTHDVKHVGAAVMLEGMGKRRVVAEHEDVTHKVSKGINRLLTSRGNANSRGNSGAGIVRHGDGL